MSDTVITGRSVHRHLTPHFDFKAKNPIAKLLIARIEIHDFKLNTFLNKARYAGGMVNLGFSNLVLAARTNRMRIEREQTLRETMKALVYCASYKPYSDSLFEIKMSIKALAKMVNQLHISEPTAKYRHGRENYNPVINALKDLAAAGLVMLQQNYSVKLKRYQSMRIFITPELFASLGVNKKTVKKLIHSQNKHDIKNGFDVNKSNRMEHLRAQSNAAIQEHDSHSLKTFKARLKNEFNVPDDIREMKEKVTSLIKKKKKEADNEQKPGATQQQVFNRLVVQLNVPAFKVYELEENIKKEHPYIEKASPPYYELLITLLKESHL